MITSITTMLPHNLIMGVSKTMSLDFATIFIYVIVPILMGIGSYAVKHIISRIEVLEMKVDDKITEPKVRQIISDKVDPLKEDLTEIKDKMDKIILLQIQANQK